MSRLARRIGLPLLSLGGLAAGLLLVEYGLRSTSYADRLGVEPTIATVNTLGLRGPREYQVNPAADVFRIICLGDSFTYGHGVRDNETYPFYLEKTLRDHYKKKIDVINAGEKGTTITQQLKIYANIRPKLKHNLVVLQVHPQDINEIVKEADKTGRWDTNWPTDRMFHDSSIYEMLKLVVLKRRSYQRSVFLHQSPNYAPTTKLYFENLRKLVDLAEGKVVVVYAPEWDMSMANEIDKMKADKSLLSTFDAATPIAERKKAGENLFLIYHLNPRGNLLMARLVAGHLMDKKLVR